MAYVFDEVPGLSRFGTYTGNGSTDGPFVWTGFRPAFVMVKDVSAGSGQWVVWDSVRDSVNVSGIGVYPNASSAETSNGSDLDFLSNGFKFRRSATNFNASSVTFIYAAFAEAPFKYANAR